MDRHNWRLRQAGATAMTHLDPDSDQVTAAKGLAGCRHE